MGRHLADLFAGWALDRVQLQPSGHSISTDLRDAGYGRRGGPRFPLSVRPGGYYTSPDWAPVGDHVAFHGRVGRRGRYNILVADVSDRGRRLRQLTWEGNNEDPSWAPDGRHLVFVGSRDWGTGLMVVDTATGTYRMLLRGSTSGYPIGRRLWDGIASRNVRAQVIARWSLMAYMPYVGSTLMLARVRMGNKRFTDRLAESGKLPDMTIHRQD